MKFLVLKSVQLQEEHWPGSGVSSPGLPLIAAGTHTPVCNERVREANESVLVPVLKKQMFLTAIQILKE